MINNQKIQRHYRTIAILSIWKWLVAILIVFVGMLVSIFTPEIDPLDVKAIKNCELIDQINVIDTCNNGFRVSYKTIRNVTSERADEIRNRKSVRDSLNRLKRMAPVEFGNMLMTDIYEFAEFAIRFDPVDIQIHNIFVYGQGKQNLYVGENPMIKNWAKYINFGTAQGLLYIRTEDIYCNGKPRPKGSRVYRYFKCNGLHQQSDTDEHFSHFSEDERLY